MGDHYEMLGVGRTADLDEIRTAYRKLALQLHPDRNPGDKEKEARFKEISHAYCVLSDDRQRARYDHELNRPAPRPAPQWSPPVGPWAEPQEMYRATRASFFYQYGERKRRRQQGQAGADPFGRRYGPFGRVDPFAAGSSASSSVVLHTEGDPFSDPAPFTVAPPVDMGRPVKLVNPNRPVPGQSVPVMPHPQYGPIPVFFIFRNGRPFQP